MNRHLAHFYCGTSGLLLPVPNKLHYPAEFQDKSRISYYSSLVNTIEINSCFYQIPLSSTVKRWSEQVPDEFCFTFKLFKGITHNRDLAFDASSIAKFFEVVNHVGEKRACILAQLPPSVGIRHIAQLRVLLSELRASDPAKRWNIALEVRNLSLQSQRVNELLQEFNMALVVHDKLPLVLPNLAIQPDFVYLRLHGPNGNYRGNYDLHVLEEFAGYASEWLFEGKKVFVYFNNSMGNAFENLLHFKQLVKNLTS